MTHDEFRRQYYAYNWEPYQPLAVILANGDRVYIDKPGQAACNAEAVAITRWQNPERPEHYRYADIARLVPMLDLPADPAGMSYAEFDPLIRELLMAEPFRPFVVELKTGERIELDERGGTVRAGRFIVMVGDPPRSFVEVEYDQIARIATKAAAAMGGG